MNATIAKTNYFVPSFLITDLSVPEAFMLEDSLLQANGFIKPIARTHYDFELRCEFYENVPFDIFYLIIIQGNKRTIKGEYYILHRVAFVVGDMPKIVRSNYEISITNKPLNIVPRDSLFRQLIDNHLFDIKGYHIDYPKGSEPDRRRHIDGKVVFRLKFNDQYRSFLLLTESLKHRPLSFRVRGDGKSLLRTVFKTIGSEKEIVE
jgi:hypothetical protein